MRYSYVSGYDNYRKSLRTYIRSTPRVRVLFHLQVWGLALIGVVCLLSFAHSTFQHDFHLGPFIGYLIGCGCLGGGLVGAALMPWQRKRFYRMFNGDDRVLNLYMEVDTPFLILGRPGRTETRLERAAVGQVIEDDEIMLLFLSKKKFVYLPKSVGEPALEELRSWLRLPGSSPC